MQSGLQDPGRHIDRAPEAVAQMVLSHVRVAGELGVDLDELQALMPAHGADELADAVDQLERAKCIRRDRARIIALEQL